jgi:hypothetical protein
MRGWVKREGVGSGDADEGVTEAEGAVILIDVGELREEEASSDLRPPSRLPKSLDGLGEGASSGTSVMPERDVFLVPSLIELLPPSTLPELPFLLFFDPPKLFLNHFVAFSNAFLSLPPPRLLGGSGAITSALAASCSALEESAESTSGSRRGGGSIEMVDRDRFIPACEEAGSSPFGVGERNDERGS